VATTGRNLDVAVRGDSWFAVQALDGTEAYTRAGSFDLSADGTLVTQAGLQVLGDGGPIQLPPNSEPSVAGDGSISARLPNGTSSVVGKLKLVTPEAPLNRGDDGLFRADGGDPLEADPAAQVLAGALEGSNVSAVGSMVAMIAAARQFEAQMKMMQTAEADEKAAAQLLAAN
jgi:flagellar basal-body rod protein FlgF